jgi:hypothetical protein
MASCIVTFALILFKLLKTFIFYNKQKPELVAFMHLSKDGFALET